MIRIAIGAATIISLCIATPASTQQPELSAGGELFEKIQSEFAEAYNRKDIVGMAALLARKVRITPAGVFRGRDAIERELRRVVTELGLHDFRARRTVSRLEGGMVFNAGEWQAKVGEKGPTSN
jgi:hypothetical protein